MIHLTSKYTSINMDKLVFFGNFHKSSTGGKICSSWFCVALFPQCQAEQEYTLYKQK